MADASGTPRKTTPVQRDSGSTHTASSSSSSSSRGTQHVLRERVVIDPMLDPTTANIDPDSEEALNDLVMRLPGHLSRLGLPPEGTIVQPMIKTSRYEQALDPEGLRQRQAQFQYEKANDLHPSYRDDYAGMNFTTVELLPHEIEDIEQRLDIQLGDTFNNIREQMSPSDLRPNESVALYNEEGVPLTATGDPCSFVVFEQGGQCRSRAFYHRDAAQQKIHWTLRYRLNNYERWYQFIRDRMWSRYHRQQGRLSAKSQRAYIPLRFLLIELMGSGTRLEGWSNVMRHGTHSYYATLAYNGYESTDQQVRIKSADRERPMQNPQSVSGFVTDLHACHVYFMPMSSIQQGLVLAVNSPTKALESDVKVLIDCFSMHPMY